ncbi:YkgJ family cysteine cluster protein [Candidatus Woesearchaeota archaeon]|nr:YkgJ family cysteine cluster protein [Candidatus Woesearchaeota archaeon]
MKVKNCFECDSLCCRYLYIQFADPDDHINFESLKWFLFHKNISVIVDNKKHLWIKLDTPCKNLDPETNLCTQYHSRPNICRKHQMKNCEFQGGENDEKRVLNSPQDVIELKKEVRQAKIKEMNKVIELIKKSDKKENQFLKDIDQKNLKAFEEGKELRKQYLAKK